MSEIKNILGQINNILDTAKRKRLVNMKRQQQKVTETQKGKKD